MMTSSEDGQNGRIDSDSRLFQAARQNRRRSSVTVGGTDIEIDDNVVKQRSKTLEQTSKQKERKMSVQYGDVGDMYIGQLYSADVKATQGTNFKHVSDSLYVAIRPLLFLMKCLGLFHTREWQGRSQIITPSMLYSIILMLILWASVIRFFTVYETDAWYGEKLFFKIARHIWWFQVAAASTCSFFAARNVPNFFERCHKMMKDRILLPYRNYIRKWSIVYCVIAAILVIVNVIFIAVWFNTPNSQYTELELTPFYRGQEAPVWFRVIYIILTFFASCAYSFSMSLMVTFCLVLKKEFNLFFEKFKNTTSVNGEYSGNIEEHRREHLRICGLVVTGDDIFNLHTLIVYVTDVPAACLLTFNLIFDQFGDSLTLPLLQLWLLLAAIFRLYTVTVAATLLNEAGTAPLDELHEMRMLDQDNLPSDKMVQIRVFIYKLTGAIGFTGWQLFTITRDTTTSIFIAVTGYIIAMMTLQTGFNPFIRAVQCACNCTPPMSDLNSTYDNVTSFFQPNVDVYVIGGEMIALPAIGKKSQYLVFEENTSRFISPDEWPPNTLDANSCDYHTLRHLEQLIAVNSNPPQTIDQLKEVLQEKWRELPQKPLQHAIDQFRPRQCVIVKMKGGCIEHAFNK
ncbi:unnamed protein product [Owenia fusiformis]|uniref:Uncharacterized protein n=1 Tax=Owenia fusiformis TaxID=6347 RepID=A0A8J1TXF4_OWEFU|nr:unnamed protein product [Owenia fusiformis]